MRYGKVRRSRKDKDILQGSRARTENGMTTGVVMTFGKWVGQSVSAVDDGYLFWCIENMEKPPLYICAELKARGYNVNAIASNALSSKKAKQLTRRIDRSEKATAPREMEGRDYQRLRDEWELAGGREDECPFGDEYTGPTLTWAGGQPVIVPSEFKGG